MSCAAGMPARHPAFFMKGIHMKTLGYYNGKYGELEEMSVPMLDRACYFGDGVYDATYSRNHIIYNLNEHIDRFFNSAALLGIRIPKTKDEMKQLLSEMVQKVDDGEQFVYWQATRGSGIRRHYYGDDMTANIWIMLTPTKITDNSKPIHLTTAEDTRFFHCNAKTLNLIPNVIAAKNTEDAGCRECVFHRGERVTECAHSNVHILKDGVFRTAPTDNLILPGIARANLIKMCRKNNIPVDETPFTVREMMDADEVIVSSSGSFCLSADTIDGKPVGGKAPQLLEILRRDLIADWLQATEA